MNVRYALLTLVIASLLELIFGIWIMTADKSMKCNLPCEIQYLDTSLWFIVKGLISLYLGLLLYTYCQTSINTKCNLFVSTVIWILIFAHFTWNIIGCQVFWKCTGDNSSLLEKNVLWFDVLIGFLLLVFHIKLMFDINQKKNAQIRFYYNNDYILTYV
jgi:hypothetical protein